MPSFLPVFVTEPGPFQPGHGKENSTGSHLKNEVTVSSKTTPSQPIRKSLRQNMVRNINVCDKHVRKHMKEYDYMKAFRALREGRNNLPILHIKMPLTHLYL